MKNINWSVRFKNPVFLFQLGVSILAPILGYFGLATEDLTTWKSVGDLLMNAIQNPYVVMLIGVSAYNAVNDPTTKGHNDSEQAMEYKQPK